MRLEPLPGARRPLVFAHRGLSSEAPENTMASFGRARAAGIPGIELDVHLTADGSLAVIHDDTTARTSPGSSLRVEESSMADLKALDIGSWKDTACAGERVITLSELFEAFGGDFYYDIEIKQRVAADRGLEATLARVLSDARMDAGRIVVSSFNPLCIGRFKRLAPAIPTAIIYRENGELPWYLRHGEGRWLGSADLLKPRHSMVRPAAMAVRRAFGGRPVLPWTVDDPAEAARLVGLGCVGVVSNAPHLLGLA